MLKCGVIVIGGVLCALSVQATEIATSKVILRGVDKITGRVSTMQAAVGDDISFGDLHIVVSRCYTHPPEETPEDSAYLTITQTKQDGVVAEVFNGWMFSSNPALSAMEHPVYDVWVLSCMDTFKRNVKTLSEMVEADFQAPSQETLAEEDNPALAED
ncbi:MAG: DUF2155 domain-containing protein [Alphaproteobacteria bacterium]